MGKNNIIEVNGVIITKQAANNIQTLQDDNNRMLNDTIRDIDSIQRKLFDTMYMENTDIEKNNFIKLNFTLYNLKDCLQSLRIS